jgi:hypothetical protein
MLVAENLSGPIGVEVTGVDLTRPTTSDEVAKLNRLFVESLVLVVWQIVL